MNDDDVIHSEQRQRIHDIRNRLNNISIQTELALMLISQGESNEKVIAPLEKVLLTCKQCSEELTSLSKQP